MDLTNNIPDDFEDLQKYAPTLAKLSKENCFVAPDGYFEELPEVIRVAQIASRFDKQNPFDVPAGYFDELPVELVAGIFANGLAEEMKAGVPANYFEELPKEIETGIIASTFPKENPFALPDTYFDQLPAALQKKITAPEKEVKVLNLDWFNKTQLLAVAASFLIVCLIGFNYWKKSIPTISKTQVASLSTQPEKTLEERMENVDESTLEDALSDEEGSTQSASTATASNEYIVNYLIDNHIDIGTLMTELKNTNRE